MELAAMPAADAISNIDAARVRFQGHLVLAMKTAIASVSELPVAAASADAFAWTRSFRPDVLQARAKRMYAQATVRSPNAPRSEVGLEADELDPPVSTDK